ncbi:MAG: YhfC family intramembrane metalloprotease, partial [Chloroflexi bacterium]|nr:YhfC family intramembrane metalloprotease [Chloroflexota bacterium]
MLYLIYPLNALLMMALGVGLGLFLARRLNLRWGLFGVGAVTFVASQVVHIPLNYGLTWLFANHVLPGPPAEWQLLFNVTVLGLTAGLCEETARYAVYRWWIRSARTWREALMFGAGHGGIEAIL